MTQNLWREVVFGAIGNKPETEGDRQIYVE